MSARRRRVGSESEQQPLILIDNLSQQLPQSSNFPGSRLVETSDNNEKPNKTYLKHQDQINRPNMSRDRTAEFSNAIRSLQGRHVIRAIATQDPVRAKTIQSYGEFMMLARTIGKNISSTYAKLEKLTLRKYFFFSYTSHFIHALVETWEMGKNILPQRKETDLI